MADRLKITANRIMLGDVLVIDGIGKEVLNVREVVGKSGDKFEPAIDIDLVDGDTVLFWADEKVKVIR